MAGGRRVLTCRTSTCSRTREQGSGVLLECFRARQFCQPGIVEVTAWLAAGPTVRAVVRPTFTGVSCV